MNKRSIAKTVSLVQAMKRHGVENAEKLLTTVEPKLDKSGAAIPNSEYLTKANHMTRRKRKLLTKAKDYAKGNPFDPKQEPVIIEKKGEFKPQVLLTPYEKRERHLRVIEREFKRHGLKLTKVA